MSARPLEGLDRSLLVLSAKCGAGTLV